MVINSNPQHNTQPQGKKKKNHSLNFNLLPLIQYSLLLPQSWLKTLQKYLVQKKKNYMDQSRLSPDDNTKLWNTHPLSARGKKISSPLILTYFHKLYRLETLKTWVVLITKYWNTQPSGGVKVFPSNFTTHLKPPECIFFILFNFNPILLIQ